MTYVYSVYMYCKMVLYVYNVASRSSYTCHVTSCCFFVNERKPVIYLFDFCYGL